MKNRLWYWFENAMLAISVGGVAGSLEGWVRIFEWIYAFLKETLYLLAPLFKIFLLVLDTYKQLAKLFFGWLPVGSREYLIVCLLLYLPLLWHLYKRRKYSLAQFELRFVMINTLILILVGANIFLVAIDSVSHALLFSVFVPCSGYFMLSVIALVFGIIDKDLGAFKSCVDGARWFVVGCSTVFSTLHFKNTFPTVDSSKSFEAGLFSLVCALLIPILFMSVSLMRRRLEESDSNGGRQGRV